MADLAGERAMRVAADRVRSTQERCQSRLVQVDKDVPLKRTLGFVDDVNVDLLVADIFAGLTEAGYVLVDRDISALWGEDEWDALGSLLRTTDAEWLDYEAGSDRDVLHQALARFQVRECPHEVPADVWCEICQGEPF